jgi:hypothetical protein
VHTLRSIVGSIEIKTMTAPRLSRLYRDRLDKQILPSLGELRLRELSVGVVDRHIAAVKVAHGPSLAETTRSVLSGLFTLACRYDALATNPMPRRGRLYPQVG